MIIEHLLYETSIPELKFQQHNLNILFVAGYVNLSAEFRYKAVFDHAIRAQRFKVILRFQYLFQGPGYIM